jgi:hypothetical protein
LYPPFDMANEWGPAGTDEQIRAAEAQLEAAKADAHKIGVGGPDWREAWARIPPLEREAARLRGDEYAVEIEVDAPIDVGAPSPSVIAHEHAGTYVVYFSREDSPITTEPFDAESTSKPIDASSLQTFGVLTFERVSEVLFGGPNDEALQKHRLYGNGIGAYAVHEVFNSRWAAMTWNYNVPVGQPGTHRARHFVAVFHDSTLEVLAQGMTCQRARRVRHELLAELAAGAGEAPNVIRPDLVYRPGD